jgi:hypothetical protein
MKFLEMCCNGEDFRDGVISLCDLEVSHVFLQVCLSLVESFFCLDSERFDINCE